MHHSMKIIFNSFILKNKDKCGKIIYHAIFEKRITVMEKGMMLVGLCGRSGSGKGYISKMFAQFGIPSIDTDVVYHNLTGSCTEPSSCMKELIERFGTQIISADGSLDRGVMRSLVFGEDKQALRDLNSITHKHILEDTLRMADELYRAGNQIILVDAPLLYESGFDKICECVVCVTAPEDVIISRIMKRDGISFEDAQKRLASQKTVAELEDRADFLIVNNDEKEILRGYVKECADKLAEIYRKKYIYQE